MSAIDVTSEIKPLKEVLLHRPGKELLNLTPDTLERLLFDDIPYLEVAQKEHDEFANILKENGAKEIYAGATHGVLVGPAIERIKNSPIKELVVTNTIPIEPEKMIDKIKVVSIAPLFAEAIKRINESKPLGDLFEYDK